MAAPTLAATAFNTAFGAPTTASVTWQSGDVVAVAVGTEGAGTETWSAPTTTGSGLSLAQQQLHPSASNCGGGLWAAQASAGSSGTFTITDPGGGTTSCTLAVYIGRGSGGIGASNIAASSTRTLALTPLGGADGLMVWTVFDWSAAAVQTATPTPTTHSASAPGPSASPTSALVSPRYTYYVEELDDQTSAGATSYGIGGTGTGPFTIVVFEMKAGAGGAAAAAPIRPKFPSRVPIFRAANY